MKELKLGSSGQALKVLCLGAHSDDIEIGCGGTVLELVASHRRASFDWVVLSAGGRRKREAEAGAEAFLAGAGGKNVILRDFRDGFFPYEGGAIKGFFEELKLPVRPDVVFTHARADLHQDHRLVSELTWNTFRDHLILEYEIPKYDGDLGAPNAYVPLSPESRDAKVRLILKCFGSQAGNRWFSKETFLATMRLRGIESNAVSGYAEAFYARKLVIG
jgi:LmbE family N-acetylglucosaminyl deacetylase